MLTTDEKENLSTLVDQEYNLSTWETAFMNDMIEIDDREGTLTEKQSMKLDQIAERNT